MSRAAALQKKVNQLLGSTSTFDRTVYLRRTVSTGGDPLIGRPGVVTHTDTKLDPQPFTQRLGRERIPGGHTKAETYQINSKMKIGDDYSIMVSGSVISLDQLNDPSYQFVFKDSYDAEEVLAVHDFETISLDGANLVYVVYARSGSLA